jgi:hypothetical protein
MPLDGSLAMQSLFAFDHGARLATLCSARVSLRAAKYRECLSRLTGCEARLAVLDRSRCSSSRRAMGSIGDGVSR